jgi:hypothetical protein
MNSDVTVRIKGHSDKAFSSDALYFYKDYWMKGTKISSHNLQHRKII